MKFAHVVKKKHPQNYGTTAQRDRTVILAEATRDSEKIRGEGDACSSKNLC